MEGIFFDEQTGFYWEGNTMFQCELLMREPEEE